MYIYVYIYIYRVSECNVSCIINYHDLIGTIYGSLATRLQLYGVL